jgi:methyl-accepting chemotaxis protein
VSDLLSQNEGMKKALRFRFLIEREVQMQIVGYILLIWFISTLAMAYLVNSATHAAFDFIISESGPSRDRLVPVLMSLESNIRWFGLIGILIGMIGSLLGGIVVSHRVAGPIFALRRAIDEAAESGNLSKISFRRTDFTKNLAEAYNRMVEKIQPPSGSA